VTVAVAAPVCKNAPVTGKLVIAVDAVRRGRGGPFVAAALAYVRRSLEPQFRFTDGRGTVREEFLLRRDRPVPPHQVLGLSLYIRASTVAAVPYRLPPEKAPRDPEAARLVAMFWAVRKLSDRLKHCHRRVLEGLSFADLQLVVAGKHHLVTHHFEHVPQVVCPDGSDWRVRAARFYAANAFQERA